MTPSPARGTRQTLQSKRLPPWQVFTRLQLQEVSPLRNRLLALHAASQGEKQTGWAMRMTFEDSVKPCGRGGEAAAATVCGSAQHHAGTGACGGLQPICVPRGTKASILCRAGVRAAPNACGWQCALEQGQVRAACAQSIPKTSGVTWQSNIGHHSSTQTRAAATCLSKREAVDSDLMESRPAKTRLCHLTELCPMTPSCGRPLFTIPQP